MTDSLGLPKDVSDSLIDELIQMKKVQSDDRVHSLGSKYFVCNLSSLNGREQFFLDYSRGNISLKYTLQCRARTTIQLLRLDIGGGWHKNPVSPDKNNPEPYSGYYFEPGEPHIHKYREEYGDRWAYPAKE